MNDIEKGQLAKSTIQCFQRADGSLSNFPGLLKRVIEEKAWECRINNGREIRLHSLRELITLPPIEGWGQDPQKIEDLLRNEIEILPMYREAMKGKANQHTCRADNVSTAETPHGNSRAYTLERLKKNEPELFAEVVKGSLSANAAAIKAGWRKLLTPLEKTQKAFDAMSEEDQAIFADRLASRLEDEAQ
tara:strand:- start:27 stop:596 length:570 start_codon:yes stop_codon:yes gene_type:complete